MQPNEIFSDPQAVTHLAEAIKREAVANKKYRIMEVCGTHTMSIARFGIKSLLPSNIELISGPGCPVCVTSQSDIDNCIDLAYRPGITTATFGDMLRVAGSDGRSLYDAKASGCDIRVVYSPLDIITPALENPDKEFVFLAVGFETTIPMAAGLIHTAHGKKIKNISLYSMCKTMPAAFDLLLNDTENHIDGFLCPGNVSIITGVSIYEPLVKARKAAVISGFEPADILSSVLNAVRQINRQNFHITNNYLRACNSGGNSKATALTTRCFEPCNARWRGLGVLKNSGMSIKKEYDDFNAVKKYSLDTLRQETPTPCRCGDILKGRMTPEGCPLFGKTCTPSQAVGPCMVSSEGACAAHYKYAALNQV